MVTAQEASPVILSFIDGYYREFDYYQEAARLCAVRCESLLVENGIRARVTHRAKRPNNLREKLIKRNQEKTYRNQRQIREDIVDLSGVRIELYFPGDRPKVKKLVESSFDVIERKEFPTKKELPKGKVFTGYHATHFRVKLKDDSLAEAQKRYSATKIEIQVASVLMHAWSEVEHDLIYKPLSGEISEDEYAILDELNGLMLSGEIALERLQRAVDVRVTKQDSKFTNHYELAAYLYEEFNARQMQPATVDMNMGRVDVLLLLLREAALDTPAAIRPFMDALDTSFEARPLADQLVDVVVGSQPDLYQKLLNIQRNIRGKNPLDFGKKQHQPKAILVGQFLEQWIRFERFVRKLAELKNITPVTKGPIMPGSKFLRQLEIDEGVLSIADRLRQLRNQTLHGVRAPDEQVLNEAKSEFDLLFARLNDSIDPDVKVALTWAGSDER